MSPEQRAQVWAKTNGHCWYCGKFMNPWQDFTIDHMKPRTQGGGDDVENLVPACRSCNSSKHAKTVEEFRAFLLDQKRQTFWGEYALRLPAGKQEDSASLRSEITRLSDALALETQRRMFHRAIAHRACDLLDSDVPLSSCLTLLTLMMWAEEVVPSADEASVPAYDSVDVFLYGFVFLGALARRIHLSVPATLSCLFQLEAWGCLKFTDVPPRYEAGFPYYYTINTEAIAAFLLTRSRRLCTD